MKYKRVNLLNDEILEENSDITPLFANLKMYQVIIKGKKQEIVAGKPANMLDVMNRELAHTLPELHKVYL